MVSVTGFSNEYEAIHDVPIVTAATAYDDPSTGTTVILIIGQALYLNDKVSCTLLCPNQLCSNGISVDDIPFHLAPRDRPTKHAIYSEDRESFHVPLQFKGCISYFHSRTLTQEELETCRWITITDKHHWDLHSDSFQEGLLSVKKTAYYIFDDELDQLTQISSLTFPCGYNVSVTSSSTRTSQLSPESLAKRWGIGLEAAKNTIRVTTQKEIRSTLYPIERHFRTKQAQLRYRQLSGRHGRFYTDKFFSNQAALNGAKMAQLYIDDIGFRKIYTMKTKGETADTLSAFIHKIGIPHAIHSDDAKELTQGRFRSICKDYSIPCTSAEPYSPWQNRAEGGIRELKRHIHRKMKARNVPQRLWDFRSKWSCVVRSKTTNNHPYLEGRTPFEAITGNTPDILGRSYPP
jgi:hypothetical protein